ncbi:partial Large cysteine-rich periplasmic protein OmcB, partial [Gammaproteobacteria bacterium]
LPAGAQFISSNPPATPYPNGVLLFTAPSVGPGTGNTSVTVRVQVATGYEQLDNRALVMAEGVTPTLTSLLTTIAQPASNWLRLVKSGPSAVLTNGQLVYTVQATNLGSAPLTDVTVVDVLPGGPSFISASPQPDLVTLPMLRWSLGSLNPAESKSIVITTTAPATAGIITNSAMASAWQNVVTQTLLSTQIVSTAPILQVTKSGSAPAVDLGDTLVYTLRYSNAGNQTATTVRLTDTLPANLTVIATSPAVDVQTAQQLAWNLGTLNVGAQGQVVITTTVGGAGGRVLHNVADIAGQAGSYPGHAELDTPVRLIAMYLPVIRRN